MKTLDPAPERWRGTGGALEGSPKEDRMKFCSNFKISLSKFHKYIFVQIAWGGRRVKGDWRWLGWVGGNREGGQREESPPALGGSGRTENSHGEPAAFSLVSRHSQIVTLIENDLLRFSLNNW